MRKIVAGLFVSLDGVVTSPNVWAFSRYLDAELGQIIAAGVRQADAVLLGRRTYEEFSKIWPNQPDTVPMARFLNGSPKHVVSSTLLDPLGWARSTVLRGTLADELAVSICPVVVGAGGRLFDGICDLSLRVRESRVLGTGVLHAVYEPHVSRDPERPIAFPDAAGRGSQP